MFEDNQQISSISHRRNNYQSQNHQFQSKNDMLLQILVNTPQDQRFIIHSAMKKQQSIDKQHKDTYHKHPYNLQATGYSINRQLYSDQEIIQAFNTIDINKDNLLTTDDISFFLKCMGEQHTDQQVQEMIRLVSTNGKTVVLDDFKKIGKGKIIPLAGIKLPDKNTEAKQRILQNLEKSNLLGIAQPDRLVLAEESQQLSFNKFESEKSKRSELFEHKTINLLEEQVSVLRNRTRQQIRRKRNMISKLHTFNIEIAIQNLKNNKQQILESRDLSQILTINQKFIKQLFFESYKTISIKQAIMDIILFSSKSFLQRLELILLNYSYQELLKFQQWIDILVFIIGIDQKEMIKRKLIRILKQKKLQEDQSFDKYFIIQLMNQSSYAFKQLQN